ncbi:hypothetical protein CEK29_03980 [Bordetella genomosp. 5]|nr:hypothetical protein CEK29_03980 [Bordetella genomosp. 5]
MALLLELPAVPVEPTITQRAFPLTNAAGASAWRLLRLHGFHHDSQEMTMPTFPTVESSAPDGTDQLDVQDNDQLNAWRERLGVTQDQLEQAIHEVGTEWVAVRDYLATPASGRTS